MGDYVTKAAKRLREYSSDNKMVLTSWFTNGRVEDCKPSNLIPMVILIIHVQQGQLLINKMNGFRCNSDSSHTISKF